MERKSPSLDILFEDFITDRILKGASEKTIISYRLAFAHYLKNSDGKISKDSWKNYLANLVNSDLAVASKNHYITHMRAFYYYIMNEGFIPEFKIHLMRGQETGCKAYTDEELKTLLSLDLRHCSYTEHRCYSIICFILATGARANTIINVKTTDITGEYLSLREQKNKKASIIPLSVQCQKVLREFRNSWNTDSEWLFPDCNGNQLSWSGLRLSMEKYFRKKNVKYHGVHAFRHTFSKLFILNGGSAFQLQKMLGHSTLEMTKKYVYLYASEVKEAIQSVTPLDNIITKKRG